MTTIMSIMPTRLNISATLVTINSNVSVSCIQRTSVRVSGYDAVNREVVDETAGVDVIDAEISKGRTGPSILASAFGDRVSHRTRDVPISGGEAAEAPISPSLVLLESVGIMADTETDRRRLGETSAPTTILTV